MFPQAERLQTIEERYITLQYMLARYAGFFKYSSKILCKFQPQLTHQMPTVAGSAETLFQKMSSVKHKCHRGKAEGREQRFLEISFLINLATV